MLRKHCPVYLRRKLQQERVKNAQIVNPEAASVSFEVDRGTSSESERKASGPSPSVEMHNDLLLHSTGE